MFFISGKLSIFVAKIGKTIIPNEINKMLSTILNFINLEFKFSSFLSLLY